MASPRDAENKYASETDKSQLYVLGDVTRE